MGVAADEDERRTQPGELRRGLSPDAGCRAGDDEVFALHVR